MTDSGTHHPTRLYGARWRPWLRWVIRLRRFRRLVPVVSFIAGAASFFLVQRQGAMAQWLAIFLLLSWFAILAENVLGRLIRYLTGFYLPSALVRLGTQGVHQETLFFVLPFLIATTTWTTGQSLFTGLVALAAFVSVVDPFYFGVIAARRWLFLAFHAFTVFLVVLAGLPILFQLTTGESLVLAAGAMALFSVPSVAQVIRVRRWWRWGVLTFVSICLGASFWAARAWVPPATLWVTESRVSMTLDESDLQPGPPVSDISVDQLRDRGLYAFTAIRAPRGLHERVLHVWSHEGQVVDRIDLEITGGRERGYRAWTHKRSFPAESEGDWKVSIVTGVGQLIGVIRFDVDKAPAD